MNKIRTPKQEARHQDNIKKYYNEIDFLNIQKHQIQRKLQRLLNKDQPNLNHTKNVINAQQFQEIFYRSEIKKC